MSSQNHEFPAMNTASERCNNEKIPLLEDSNLGSEGNLEAYAEDERTTLLTFYKLGIRRTRGLTRSVWPVLALAAIWVVLFACAGGSFRTSRRPTSRWQSSPLPPLGDFDDLEDGPWEIEVPSTRATPYHCPIVTHAKSVAFGFNYTNGSGQKKFLLQDRAPDEAKMMLFGDITVMRGSAFQLSDIEVNVVVNTNHEDDVDNVKLRQGDQSLGMDYDYTPTDGGCTEVHFTVSLRPWPKVTLDVLQLETNLLDISIDNMLVWEIHNLSTHTSIGYTWIGYPRNDMDTFVAHNITLSSTRGYINGVVIPHTNLAIRTSEYGRIAVSLGSYSGDDTRKFDPKSIHIATESGSVSLRTAYDGWPLQPYTHRTHVETVSGHVYASLPHGAHTNVSNINGSITAWFRPFFTHSKDTKSEIYTSLEKGDLGAYIEDPVDGQSGHGDFDPLANIVSHHTVGEGTLRVRYGSSWYGELDAGTKKGKLNFDSTELEEVKKSKGHVTARRGHNGKSRLNAHVDSGDLSMRIGL